MQISCYSIVSSPFSIQALWTKNGSCIVYPCHAIIVTIDVSSGQQQFFMGHTDKVLVRFSFWFTALVKNLTGSSRIFEDLQRPAKDP